MKYVSDEATLEKIGKAAKFLCGTGKFGLLLYGTVGRDVYKRQTEESLKNHETEFYLNGVKLATKKAVSYTHLTSCIQAWIALRLQLTRV